MIMPVITIRLAPSVLSGTPPALPHLLTPHPRAAQVGSRNPQLFSSPALPGLWLPSDPFFLCCSLSQTALLSPLEPCPLLSHLQHPPPAPSFPPQPQAAPLPEKSSSFIQGPLLLIYPQGHCLDVRSTCWPSRTLLSRRAVPFLRLLCHFIIMVLHIVGLKNKLLPVLGSIFTANQAELENPLYS